MLQPVRKHELKDKTESHVVRTSGLQPVRKHELSNQTLSRLLSIQKAVFLHLLQNVE